MIRVGVRRPKRRGALASASSLLAFVAALSIGGATATARAFEEDARAKVRDLFQSADRDRNGSLSEEEYLDAELNRYGVSFDRSDANGDGSTTLAEYVALFERHHPVGRKSEL